MHLPGPAVRCCTASLLQAQTMTAWQQEMSAGEADRQADTHTAALKHACCVSSNPKDCR